MFLFCTMGFLLGMLVPCCEGFSPRTVIRINQAALNYVAETQRSLFQKLLSIQLPDFFDQEEEGDMQRSPVFMFDNSIPQFILKFIPNSGVRLSAAGHVNMKVFLKKNLLKLKAGVNILADIVISQATIGSLLADVSLCNSTIEDINVTYKEDELKELWNPLREYIRIILPDKLCSKLHFVAEELNVYMGTMTGLYPLGPESQISYSLTHPPTITEEHMFLNISTTLYLLGKPIVLPPPVSSFSLPHQVGSKNAMVDFVLPKELFDSIYFLMQKSGSINLDITGQLNSVNNQLTTSVLGLLIPEVRRQFPMSMPIMMKARISSAPTSTILGDEVSLKLPYYLEVLAVSSNSAFKSLFSLDVIVELKLSMFVSGVKLQGSVSFLKDIELKVNASNMGAFDLEMVKPLITSAFKNPLLDHLNALFGLGAMLPNIAKLSYITPEIFVHEGYIVVSCGLHFQS